MKWQVTAATRRVFKGVNFTPKRVFKGANSTPKRPLFVLTTAVTPYLHISLLNLKRPYLSSVSSFLWPALVNDSSPDALFHQASREFDETQGLDAWQSFHSGIGKVY